MEDRLHEKSTMKCHLLRHNHFTFCSDCHIWWGPAHDLTFGFPPYIFSRINSILSLVHIPALGFPFPLTFFFFLILFTLFSSSANHIMNRNGHRDEKSCCYFHPRQVVVGVCPLCLNERLLVLAAKQGLPSSSTTKFQTSAARRKPKTSSIHRIFAFSSLFSRQDSQHWKSQTYQYDDSSPSPEESFISIKFEKNGVASWEKNSTTTTTAAESKNEKVPSIETTKSVIEHGKSRDALRWRKKIGHIFHVMRWRRPTKSSVEGGKKVRKGWMRTSLTKRRTME